MGRWLEALKNQNPYQGELTKLTEGAFVSNVSALPIENQNSQAGESEPGASTELGENFRDSTHDELTELTKGMDVFDLPVPPSVFPAWASREAAHIAQMPGTNAQAEALEAFEAACEVFDSLQAEVKRKALEDCATAPAAPEAHLESSARRLPPELLGVTPLPAAWTPEDAALTAWFLEAVKTNALPSAPFALWPHERVTVPAVFYAGLRADTERGPAGARARTGSLQKRLRRLRELI